MPSSFLVDKALGAVAITNILERRHHFVASGQFGIEPFRGADLPVVTDRSSFLPGRLFPGRHNKGVHYFVPDYVIATEGTTPAVRLHYIGEDSLAGTLEITATWATPAVSQGVARAMDHVAALRLGYSVPVRDANGARTAGSVPEYIALQPLSPTGPESAVSVTPFATREQFQAVYQAMRNADFKAQLQITITARVGLRTWNQVVVGRPDLANQLKGFAVNDGLFTKMLTAETMVAVHKPHESTVSRVAIAERSPQISHAVLAQDFMVANPAALASRWNAHAVTAHLASPSVATSVVREVSHEARRARPASPVVRRIDSPVLRRAVTAEFVGSHLASSVVAARPADRDRPAERPPEVRSDATARPEALAATAGLRIATMQNFSRSEFTAELQGLNAPKLIDAVRASDMKIAGRNFVPIDVVLDSSKKPAIVDTDLTTSLDLAFTFLPTEHARVYGGDEPDDFATVRFLLRRTVSVGTETHQYLQDNVLHDVVYLVPTEFRLERDDVPPFLPRVSFVLNEVATTDDETQAEVLFRATMIYELEPWTDPQVIDAIRQQVESESGVVARFSSFVPTSAELVLRGAGGQTESRPEATIDPVLGITDAYEMNYDVFNDLLAHTLRQPSGLTGTVRFTAFDGTDATAQASLSFFAETSGLFGTTYQGLNPGTVDMHTVVIRNQVESDATIRSIPAVPIRIGANATLANPQILGTKLAPGQHVEATFRVSDPTMQITSLEPVVIGTAEPDIARLLPYLLLTTGFNSLAFGVTVEAVEGTFGPPAPGDEPLTGLLVDFDDGTKATVTPSDPTIDVTLLDRIVDHIFGSADDQHRFLYRVTNLHPSGEGARTAWEDATAAAPLKIGAATVALPF